MSLSSFCVVTNALRLNLFRLRDASRDKKGKPADLPAAYYTTNQKTEDETMQKTMKIEGMMCAHCEARVKKALEGLPEVDSAEVSHEAGTAVVTLSAAVEDAALRQAVEAQDYQVVSIA